MSTLKAVPLDSDPGPEVGQGASLVGTAGIAQGIRYLLTDSPCLIGRIPDCNISIAERSVSRQHCRIESDSGHFWLEDLGSLNGTWVNGERVQKRELMSGDRIMIGISELVFNVPPQVKGTDRAVAEGTEALPSLSSTHPLKDFDAKRSSGEV